MLFVVEGNIGAGKSSFISEIRRMARADGVEIRVIDEPIEMWKKCRNKQGKTSLEEYYEDIEGKSFQFQMMAYISRVAMISSMYNSKKICIAERTPLSTLKVFGEMLVKEGMITESQQQFLKTIEGMLSYMPHNSKTIFLDTEPHICHTNMLKRKDSSPPTLEYIYNLGKAYECVKSAADIVLPWGWSKDVEDPKIRAIYETIKNGLSKPLEKRVKNGRVAKRKN